MGVNFEGIQMIDPTKKKHAIVLTRPFLFDCRLLPKKYDGIEIKIRIQGHLPEEFKVKKAGEYPFMPENFERYVEKNMDALRKHFEKPEMTKLEMLDALAFGNFEEHKKNTQNILREKQRKARLQRAAAK
ncbi:MAG: hypothetical protein N2203_04330 [Bacteroidia bacterium]|nr:hypothetical protein [Bacteroidia bacterium]